MDKKAEIIQIMHENGSHDHNYGHLDIEHDDVDFIAEEIIKLFAIPVVVGQSEQLVCPECSSEDPDYSRGEYHCRCCGHDWAN